mmetsp:Transcript_126548/g.252952  ORF Transcript_126548/g.252952 Transcript_126548/m.252952 type:complete len:426 (+) Transcript_126548:29-1306(+)
MMVKDQQHVFLKVALCFSRFALAALASPVLKVARDGSFKIALFCDMHYGEGLFKDLRSSHFQNKMLEFERPGLIVIDGDASSNYAAPEYCKTDANRCREWFNDRWKDFTGPLEKSGTPYAYTLGNHDRIPGNSSSTHPGNETDYAVPDHWIMQKDEANRHSMTEDGPTSIHGASNYVLPILGADGKPAAYVWLLDSSDNACMGKAGWGCVYPDQVQWFRETSRQLAERDGRLVPGVMFHHIPLDEVNVAWNNLSIEVNGTRGEDICCGSVNTGLFAAIKEVGNIWGVFHGHDHNNDFVALYQGVYIGYGRKSGYGGYGGKIADKPGSRIIQLHQKADGFVTWETWIRELAGKAITQLPVKASDRNPKKELCCGMAAADKHQRALEEVAPWELAKRSCREDDDAQACRVAAGLGTKHQETLLHIHI